MDSLNTDTQRADNHVETNAEIGGMTKCQGMPRMDSNQSLEEAERILP